MSPPKTVERTIYKGESYLGGVSGTGIPINKYSHRARQLAIGKVQEVESTLHQ